MTLSDAKREAQAKRLVERLPGAQFQAFVPGREGMPDEVRFDVWPPPEPPPGRNSNLFRFEYYEPESLARFLAAVAARVVDRLACEVVRAKAKVARATAELGDCEKALATAEAVRDLGAVEARPRRAPRSAGRPRACARGVSEGQVGVGGGS